jgi:uncharacterized protein YgbK (DUF1537 family)
MLEEMRQSRVDNEIDCFLLADDLTGACDAAVGFAMRGRRTGVPIAPGADLTGLSVIAISTESRDLGPVTVRNAISTAAARAPASHGLVFKKIDSTLRGHAGVEIGAALEAFACDAAVVCPAFPRMNRIVGAGCLHVQGDADFAPIAVAAYLRAQGVADCVHTRPEDIAAAVSSGARVVTLDAVCDEDLDSIVAAGLASGLRILWAGSAGLATALARTLPASGASGPHRVGTGPVLFCIGSDHPVTVAQQQALLSRTSTSLLQAERTDAECVGAPLRRGHDVVLRIPRGVVPVERLQELVEGNRASAVLLTGGDTAALFCRAVGVQRIDIFHEILPGIPYGIIRGGAFDGVSVVTKSGGFGAPDALIQIAEHFHA